MSGVDGFRNLLGAGKGALIRAAASTQSFGRHSKGEQFHMSDKQQAPPQGTTQAAPASVSPSVSIISAEPKYISETLGKYGDRSLMLVVISKLNILGRGAANAHAEEQ